MCVIEKGSEVGAHILSGAVMDPRAMAELFPDWKEKDAPLNTPVSEDRFLFLSEGGSLQGAELAAARLFPESRQLCDQPGATCAAGWGSRRKRWAWKSFPGFAAAEVLYDDDGAVRVWQPATWA